MFAQTLKSASVLASLLIAVACSGNNGATADTTKGATQAGSVANDAAVRNDLRHGRLRRLCSERRRGYFLLCASDVELLALGRREKQACKLCG